MSNYIYRVLKKQYFLRHILCKSLSDTKSGAPSKSDNIQELRSWVELWSFRFSSWNIINQIIGLVFSLPVNHLSWIQCTVYRIQYTGSWLCHVLNKCSQCVCTFAKSREFSSFEICKGFHLHPLYWIVFGLFCFYKTSWKAKYNLFVSLLWASIPLPLASVLFIFWFWFQFDFHPQVTPGPSLNERQMSKQIYF